MGFTYEGAFEQPPVHLPIDQLSSLPVGRTIIPAPVRSGNLIQVRADLDMADPEASPVKMAELAVTVGESAITLALLGVDSFNLQNPHRLDEPEEGLVLKNDVQALTAVALGSSGLFLPQTSDIQINPEYELELKTVYSRAVRGVKKKHGHKPRKYRGLSTYHPPIKY